MKQFLKEITERNGESSSKKLWYNGACLTATIVLLWICYKDTFEDWAFISIYSVYLVTVGGFEVIIDLVNKIIEFKTGKKETPSADTPAATQ